MTSVKRFIPCLFAVVALTAPATVEAKCFSVCCSAQGVCTQAENGPCCGEICCGQCDADDCYSGWCTSPGACCFDDGSCEDLDPICCEAAGGRVIAGSMCGPPLICPTKLRPASIMSEYDFGPIHEPDAEIACHPDNDQGDAAVDPISPVAVRNCWCCADGVGCVFISETLCRFVGMCYWWPGDCDAACPW
jgi:hypothetical protein